MKRLVLILGLATLLCGCKGGLPSGSELPSPGEKLPPPPSYLEVDYTLEQELLEGQTQDEDGTVLLEYRYTLPKLTATSEGAIVGESAVAKTFNEKFDRWRNLEDVEELTEWARQDYDWRKGEAGFPFTPYSDELGYTAYITEHLVSVALNYYAYTGGAHPNTVLQAYNFDLDQGAFINPATLEENGGEFVQAVAEELLRQMRERAGESSTIEEFYWADYADIVSQWTSYAVSFSEEGMVVAFSPYELAAYAAGPQIFELPYALLKPYFSAYGKALLGLTD